MQLTDIIARLKEIARTMPEKDQEVMKQALKHLSILQAKLLRLEKKQQEYEPAYQAFMDMYCQWHQQQVGVGARITAREGKALKLIIKYLRENSKKQDDQGATLAWSFILLHWDKLSAFMQRQVSLTQIEKNLPEIIASIKQHATIQTRHNTSAQLADRIARRRREGDF